MADDALTKPEAAALRERFRIAACMLIEFEAYWCPDKRRVAFRSVTASRRFALPPHAEYIGIYAQEHQFGANLGPKPSANSDAFMSDLRDVLERLQIKRLTSLSV